MRVRLWLGRIGLTRRDRGSRVAEEVGNKTVKALALKSRLRLHLRGLK
jgi:argonaute-like protein implicated in RNA metabolism and viral defense